MLSVCELCGEEVPLEEDMRTHLLLSHFENEMSCPLCSLSGVSKDELCVHIRSAHPETQDQDCGGSPAPLKPRAGLSLPARRLKHKREDSSDGPKPSSRSPRDNFRTTVKGASSPGTSSLLTTPASQRLQESGGAMLPPPAGATAVSGGSSSSGGTAPVSGASSSSSSSAVTTGGRPRTAQQGSAEHCGDDDKDEGRITSEHSRVKQKRLSSPRKGANSVILHKNEKPHTQKTKEMMDFGQDSAPPSPPPPQPPPDACMPMFYGPEDIEGEDKRKYCQRCHDAGQKRVKTRVYCSECQVPLCFVKDKNCFMEWHRARR